jgi:hypothetical protein
MSWFASSLVDDVLVVSCVAVSPLFLLFLRVEIIVGCGIAVG